MIGKTIGTVGFSAAYLGFAEMALAAVREPFMPENNIVYCFVIVLAAAWAGTMRLIWKL